MSNSDIIHLTSNYWGGKVDPLSRNHHIEDGIIFGLIASRDYFDSVKLPEGSWEIVGLAKDLSRAQCDAIVGHNEFSVYTLLVGVGLDENILILKKKA